VNGGPELPAWLHPVREVAATMTPQMLSRHAPAPPPGARQSAVLMLFGETDGEPDVLLTERSHQLRSHPGQVSFPGGRAEPSDADPAETALREAAEEVGIDSGGVDVFATLPPLWVPPSNHAVTTVLAWWRQPHDVVAVDAREVASVLRVRVAHLMDPANRFTVRAPSGWRGPAFDLGDGLVLWGFTAGVVARVMAAVGWERPWDESREQGLPAGAAGGSL
jgi:8-oxo-dGTP pyrophosphatase MutT (NUDIX family)